MVFFQSNAQETHQLLEEVSTFQSLSKESVRVHLYWPENESESDIASRWVHRESNLMFTLSSNQNQRKTLALALALA